MSEYQKGCLGTIAVVGLITLLGLAFILYSLAVSAGPVGGT